jgi:hypothetical protein
VEQLSTVGVLGMVESGTLSGQQGKNCTRHSQAGRQGGPSSDLA